MEVIILLAVLGGVGVWALSGKTPSIFSTGSGTTSTGTVGVSGYQPPMGDPTSTLSSNQAQQTAQMEQTGIAAAGAAAAPFTFGISAAAAAIASTLLGQHVARLKGATNENTAVDQIVPTFDSFVQQVVTLVNTNQIDKPTAAQTIAQFDQAIYNQMRGLVGPPGTAWSDAVGMSGKCDKACTVGCCIYFGALGPPLSLMRLLLGDSSGRWGQSDPRLNGRTVTVPKIFPGKYSKFTRPLYTVTLA